jgi:hypothetical protein
MNFVHVFLFALWGWPRSEMPRRRLAKRTAPTIVTASLPGRKEAARTPAFSESLESSELFVLLDRPKQGLFVVLKTAFPDESSQTWFRELATHASGLSAPAPSEVLVAQMARLVLDDGAQTRVQFMERPEPLRQPSGRRLSGWNETASLFSPKKARCGLRRRKGSAPTTAAPGLSSPRSRATTNLAASPGQ